MTSSTFGDQSIPEIKLTPALPNARDKVRIVKLGKERFDTRLARTLAWTTNLQKMLRVLMREQLHWIDTPVVKGIDALDSRVTDYGDLDAFNSAEF